MAPQWRHSPKFILLVILWLGLATVSIQVAEALPARQSTIITDITTDRSQITVGDPVTITMTVTHPAAARLRWPVMGQEWGQFEVLEQRVPDTVTNDTGSATSTRSLVVTLWQPGEYRTPQLSLNVVDANDEVSEVSIPAATVTVDSVLTEGDRTLRDLKPQATLAVSFPWADLLTGLAAAALLAGAGIWLWRRRGDPAETAVPPPPPDNRPSYQVALDELARIENLDLPAQGAYKEHYSLVAGTLRRYLEAAFGLPALDRTTAEITSMLRKTSIPEAQQEALRNLLAEADLVKFADGRPGPGAARQLPPRAKEFVLATAAGVVREVQE